MPHYNDYFNPRRRPSYAGREDYATRVEREKVQKELRAITDEAIAELTNRFLAWPLPDSVCSDLCVTRQGDRHRTGTNLLTADEAKQMFKHVFSKTR